MPEYASSRNREPEFPWKVIFMKSIYFKTALIILTGCCIIFAILYFRMCFILNGLSGRVAEKKIALIETRRMFEKTAEEQSSRMALLQSRFHLVDATDAEDPNTAFQQKTVDKEGKSLVASLSAHVRNTDTYCLQAFNCLWLEILLKRHENINSILYLLQLLVC